MDSKEGQQGAGAPGGGGSSGHTPEQSGESKPHPPEAANKPEGGAHKDAAPATEGQPPATHVSYEQTTDASYGDYYDGYPTEDQPSKALAPVEPAPVATAAPPPPPPPPPKDEEPGDEEDGMLRMSFLEHLEELRKRLFMMLAGVGAAFLFSMIFSNRLWLIVSAPAVDALRQLGINPPNLSQISPMEVFNIVYLKLPILTSIFIASPWILYQIWAFIAPGLYKRERRWAAPFVICSAGLFVLGGLFAYYVAFRFGLVFLLGLGRGQYITPMVTVTEYFDLFVNVILGISIVFELPVLIFFLTLLHIVTPKFLISHSRYAILGIVILAAIVTPTPDVFNLMLFATPMILLFYVGVFASYLLVLQRENRKFPWAKVLMWLGIVLLVVAGFIYLAVTKYGYHWQLKWPFLIR